MIRSISSGKFNAKAALYYYRASVVDVVAAVVHLLCLSHTLNFRRIVAGSCKDPEWGLSEQLNWVYYRTWSNKNYSNLTYYSHIIRSWTN